MKRFEYLNIAFKLKLYRKTDWVIRAFSVFRNDTLYNYPYRIESDIKGYRFKDEHGTYHVIEDASPNEPLFAFLEKFIATEDIFSNVKGSVSTTIGNALFNLVAIIEPFGNKIPFLTGKLTVGQIEKTISLNFKDEPLDNQPKDPNTFYPSERIKFVDALSYLENFSQLCVWANSEKTITGPKGIAEYKAKLVTEYEGRLKDPATMAEFEGKLRAFDDEYLKGDLAAERFATGEKLRGVSRKKLHLAFGAEIGFNETERIEPVIKSLDEGWDITRLPMYIDNSRSGSYNRGAQTSLGGEMTKWLFRVSNGVKVTIDDCGTRLGRRLLITEKNYKKIVGLYIVGTKEPLLIKNEADAKTLVNKTVIVRSPMYCKSEGMSFCKRCVGTFLSSSETMIPTAVANYGSVMMYTFMKKMHGSALTVVKLDLSKVLS